VSVRRRCGQRQGLERDPTALASTHVRLRVLEFEDAGSPERFSREQNWWLGAFGAFIFQTANRQDFVTVQVATQAVGLATGDLQMLSIGEMLPSEALFAGSACSECTARTTNAPHHRTILFSEMSPKAGSTDT